MAVTSWAANTAFSVGDIRHATVQQATGLSFNVRLLERLLAPSLVGQQM